ncbi:MAG: hypothetical protein J2P26_10560, partial [Nocardiopsaceae bacterium]|nr:hypothetical protein [Nocardiopsaceae bacterium]
MPTDRAYGERAETYLRLLAEAALRGRAGSGDSASESGASESGASGDSASGPAEGASGPAEGQTAGQADVQRVYRAADLLVQAGILTDVQAAWILLDLTTALRARGHREPRPGRPRLARPAIFPKRPDARPGEWRVVPGPAPVPGAHVMALIVTPDRMLAPATLSAGIPDPRTTPWSGLTAADDAGTGYQTTVATSAWAGNSWTGTILIRPAPPPEIQWLKIFIPNGFSLLIPFPGRSALPGRPEPVPASPGELLLTRYAESFLAAAVQGFLAANPGGFTSVQPGLGELAGTLEAAGAL